MGAVLDSRPGSEFVAAVEAAQEVGAAVVLGDRDQRATVARLYARVRRGSTIFDEMSRSGEDLMEDDGSIDLKQGLPGMQKLKHVLEKAGCEYSETVIKSSMEMLDASLRGLPVRVDDLMKVRKCAQRVVEFVRVESFKGNPMFTPGVPRQAGKKMSIVDWATAEMVVRERDLILATTLQRDPSASAVVGVVGAGHISGM